MVRAVDSGAVTSVAPVGTNVLQDSSKNWAINSLKSCLVRISEGAGAGQLFPIAGNVAECLVIEGAWVKELNIGSRYEILAPDAREILQETLDIHSVFAWTKFLSQGIDAHFDCRFSTPDHQEHGARASDYWTWESTRPGRDGALKCPASFRGLALYTRKPYNLAAFRTKLPELDKENQVVWMGFEDDGTIGTGMAAFQWHQPALPNPEDLYIRATGHYGYKGAKITDAVPADAKTALHVYAVHILKPFVEFYIDNTLVGVGINSPNLNFSTINYPPYALFPTNAPFSTRQLGFIEVAGYQNELVHPIHPHGVRFSHIPELPSRVYRLYEAGSSTLVTGKTLAAGTLYSHPVPVFGYDKATILFRSDRSSVADGLKIQYLTQENNWRDYKAFTYAANDDFCYNLNEASLVLIRLAFTPSAYNATFSQAEVIMK